MTDDELVWRERMRCSALVAATLSAAIERPGATPDEVLTLLSVGMALARLIGCGAEMADPTKPVADIPKVNSRHGGAA